MSFVFDTNTVVSACLNKRSLPAIALSDAERSKNPIFYSEQTLSELARVLRRDKFSSFIDLNDITKIISKIRGSWVKVDIGAYDTIQVW